MTTQIKIADNAVKSGEHLSGYQARDREIIDYSMYELAGTGLSFRGPMFEEIGGGDYFTCVGAAQTFGCFCERPYPQLLANSLGMRSLNLGYGGAGPEFFDRRSDLDRFVNAGRFVVVQVMSGRSQSNSRFSCGGLELQTRRSDGAMLSATAAYRELMAGPRVVQSIPIIGRMAGRLLAASATLGLVAETRALWVESYRNWLKRIEVPVVLLWFSKRQPGYRTRIRNTKTLFHDYPQLIDQPTLNQIKSLGQHYVECISDRGSPQPLFSQFTGQPATVDPADDRPDLRTGDPWTHNRYYPSPEMHVDAAESLISVCRSLLSQ